MINSLSTKIKVSIHNMINKQIEDSSLKEMLLQFVEYQSNKGLPFGELLVLHYNMCGGEKTDEIYSIAAAVECLILSFDILDDFEDQDTTYSPWINEAHHLSLNATTALIFLSLSIINLSSFKNKDKANSLLLKYVQKSVNGQHKDLLKISQTEEDYINMTLEKSGYLVALSCVLGAVLATDKYPEEIETYSKYIGLIGQINNDLIDISVWNEKNDLLNRKYSLPIIYFLNCKDEEIKFVHQYYEGKLDRIDIINKQDLLNKKFIETGAITYSEVMKKIYQNKVLKELKKINIDPYYTDQILKYIF